MTPDNGDVDVATREHCVDYRRRCWVSENRASRAFHSPFHACTKIGMTDGWGQELTGAAIEKGKKLKNRNFRTENDESIVE